MFTENSKKNKRGLLSLFIFLILFLFIIVNANAQKISKYYTSLEQTDGTLYFIKPKYYFKNKTNTFYYDLTYKTNKDSITLNFTFIDDRIQKIKKIAFSIENKKIISELSKIFVNYKDSKGYLHRYSAKFLFSDMQNLYKFENPPIIEIISENNNAKLFLKDKKWNKDSEAILKIMNIINANIN